MFKSNKTYCLLLFLLGISLGFNINNIANSNTGGIGASRVAVVDVSTIVSNSSQVRALKKQQEIKKADLERWLQNVQNDVNKQKTDADKKALLKKYEMELAKKKEANKQEYTKKLIELDKQITKTIGEEAKAAGYSIVLTRNAVLYGGYDLTSDIQKVIK